MALVLIALAIQPFATHFTDDWKANRTHSGTITARKPVIPGALPVDWNQPVNIITSSKNPSFPLSLRSDDEYVLIINNLERTPQHSRTVHLSADLKSNDRAPDDCYFQNTSNLIQSTHSNRHLSISPVSDERQHQIPLALSDLEIKHPENERAFYLFVTEGDFSDKNKYTRITGRLIQQSPRVAVYLDDQQHTKELTAGLVNEIIKIMEQQVLDQITRKCGPIRDVDQDGRFTILLSPWLNKLQGGKTSINGFVRPSDFRESVAKPFSNHSDMLYLNSTLKPGQELLDLLSHEVTHAAISSFRTAPAHSQSGPLMDEEDWLNEGIAHIMEPGYTNRDYRISEFYRRPESYPLVVSDYYRAQLWRNHGCRGAVNLFLDWCNQIDPTQNFSYRFAHHPSTGIKKIEQLTEFRFSELFRQWSLNLVSQSLNAQAPENSLSPQSGFPQAGIHCGKFVLAGPALRTWNPFHDHSTSLKIASTASSFVHLKSNSKLAHDITIKVNGFQKMQLTLLKFPKSKERPSLIARYNDDVSQDVQSPDFVEIRLSCLHPIHSTVETISLEFGGAGLSRKDRKPRQFLTSALNSTLPALKGTLELARCGTQQDRGTLVTNFLVRLPRSALPAHSKAACWNFKAIVKTEQQTRTAIQCELKLPVKHIQRLTESTAETTVK